MGENRNPDDTPQWEQSKENVLPLRGGRKLDELSAALSGSSESKLKEQQDAFELELRMYVGDDPLLLWCRYVSWVEQNYPRGGREANLKSLLEKCVGTFISDPRYMNDGRYLDLCIKLANMYPEPTEVFSYLHSHSVGSQLASFYIAWSWILENSGNIKMADAVIQQGVSCGAQPIEKLQKCYGEFQARVVRSISIAMDDPTTSPGAALDSELPGGFLSMAGQRQSRSTLAELRVNQRGQVGNDRASAAVSMGSVVLGTAGGPAGGVQQPSTGSWKIHSDDGGIKSAAGVSNGPSLPPQNKEWARIPESAPKENSITPGVWTKAKVPQKPPHQASASSFGSTGGRTSAYDEPAAEKASSRFTVHCDPDEPTSGVSQARSGVVKNTASSSADGVAVIGYRSVLSSHKAEAPSDLIERLNSLRAEVGEGGTNSETTEVSMYDKQKLYMGVNEVCFEELRAGKWLKRQRQKLERQRELEEHNRMLEARLRAAHEAELERLHSIRVELETKQQALHEREQELERRQRGIAAVEGQQPQQHELETQQAKRLRLQSAAQPEPPLHEAAAQQQQQIRQQWQWLAPRAGGSSGGGNSASVGGSLAPAAPAAAAAAPPLGSRSAAQLRAAPGSEASLAAATGSGESLAKSLVSQLNLGAQAARKPLGSLPLEPVTVNPAPPQLPAAAPSPAGGETRHVLGWYCGSFNTSAPCAAAADQSNVSEFAAGETTAAAEWSSACQEPGPEPLHAHQRFFVHEDVPSGGATGERGPAPRLQIYEDEPDPVPPGRPGKPAARVMASDGRQRAGSALQEAQNQEVVSRLQIYEDEREGGSDASGQLPWGGGGGVACGSYQKLQVFEDGTEAHEQQASGRRLQIYEDEPSRGEQHALLQQQQLTVGRQPREALLATAAAQAEGPATMAASQQQQHRQSAFQPVKGTVLSQESAPARAAAAGGPPARAEQAECTAAAADKENCYSAGQLAAAGRQPQQPPGTADAQVLRAPGEPQATCRATTTAAAAVAGGSSGLASRMGYSSKCFVQRDVVPLPWSSDPRAGAMGAPRPTMEMEEEPMDGVETIHRDLTEQLLGVSATPFARQASTPCSYRSNTAHGLLAACPDDLTTIHPVLLLRSGACATDGDGSSGTDEESLDAASATTAARTGLRPTAVATATTSALPRGQPDQSLSSRAAAATGGAPLQPRGAVAASAVGGIQPQAGGFGGGPAGPSASQRSAFGSCSGVGSSSAANDTAPSVGFGRPATLRLSPIVERSDSSKGSSSSSSGHVTTGNSTSSQALSRAASMMSSSTTPFHTSRDSIAQMSNLLSQQRQMQPLLQQAQQSTIACESGPTPNCSAVVGAGRPAAATSGSVLSSSKPAPVGGRRDCAGKAVGFSMRPEDSDCTHSQAEDMENRGSPKRLSTGVPPPPAWNLAMPKDWGAFSDSDVLLEQLLGGDVTTHEIDTTHYCPAVFHDATQTELLINMSITSVNNPFDKKVLSKLLGRLQPPLPTYKGYCKVLAELPATIKIHQKLDLGGSCCTIVQKIGEGGFASAYVASWNAVKAHSHSLDVSAWEENEDEASSKAGSDTCLKVQQPAGGGEWEFYICSEVHRRLNKELQSERFTTDVRASIMNVSKAYFFSNGSILVNEYVRHGTLLNLVNQQLAIKCRVPEAVVMYLTVELLSIVEQLHECHVIHGDIKPDNLLLRGLFPLTPPDRALCPATRSLLLIDFGRSIDMTKFPHGTTFTASNDTSGFQCIEMKTERPWTYQTDLFGLVGTVHVLLFGEYMKVYCTGKQWKINSKFHRFWQVDLWKDLFDTLLNIPDCSSIPALAPIRRQMEERLRGSKLNKEYADFLKKYNASVPK